MLNKNDSVPFFALQIDLFTGKQSDFFTETVKKSDCLPVDFIKSMRNHCCYILLYKIIYICDLVY